MVHWSRLGQVLTKEAWPFWMFAGGSLCAWGISYVAASHLTDQVLYGGTVLQLCGLATVAHGIRQLQEMFEKPTLGNRLGAWFQNLKNAVIPKKQNGRFDVPGIVMTATVGNGQLVGVMAGLKIEERVDALEKALADMRKEQEMKFQDLDGSVMRVEGLVLEEGNDRHKGDVELFKKIEEVTVGGIRLEMIGFVWLLLGMLATSIPKVIANWVPNGFVL